MVGEEVDLFSSFEDSQGEFIPPPGAKTEKTTA